MFKRICCRVLLLALLSPAYSLALGLGDIHLKSALNAPLDADIDVVGANAEDLAALKANLASRDTFSHNGLDYPSFLGTLTFTPETRPDGRNVLHVRSADTVAEPFATLLIEVDWARGHLVREYTVLLDPPVFSSNATTAAAVAAPTTASSNRSGAVERRPSAAASDDVPATPVAAANASNSAAAAATNPSAPASASPGTSYTVRRGDTVSAIAAQTYSQSGRSARAQQLVAIYRANPSAFNGNINLLRSGSQLNLPGDAELAAIGPGEASAELHRQYASWNNGHGAASAPAGASNGSGQLRLVPPQEASSSPASAASSKTGASGAADAAASANSAALAQRVQQLESQLQESQRLLQVRNAELAALQARATQTAPTAAAPAPSPTAAAPPAPTAALVPPPVASAPVPPAQAPSTAPTPAAATPAETPPPAVATTPVVKPKSASAPESGGSMLDLIAEYWYVPAGLVLVLVVLLVLRVVRSRQEDEFDRSLGRLSQPSFDGSSTATLRAADTMPVRSLPTGREEQSYRVEETGSHEQPMFGQAAVHDRNVTTGQHVAMDEGIATDAPVTLDQGDPLAEADFHMAYGLYDQAADLVQIAISREPNRRDLRLKLLEVFFVWGNKDRFLQSAHELASTRDHALPGEWEKIVIMGRQIAPEDSLFTNSGALTGAASGGVDLNLEGGQNRVDFDLLGEPSVSGTGGEQAVDLDFGAALGDTDPTGEADRLDTSGVDFVLDDPQRGNDSTGSTREMPRALGNTATVRLAGAAGAEADVPTVEQPQLRGDDNPTIRQKIDAAARAGMMTSDQTAELALDDLGLDLGVLDSSVDEPSGADAPTMLAGLDDETHNLLARAEKEGAKPASPSGPAPSESGTWLFSDTDFVSVIAQDGGDAHSDGADAPTELVKQISAPPVIDSSSTSRMAALKGDDLDLNDPTLRHRSAGNGLDLDVGSPSAGEGTFVQTQKIAADEIPLPDLEPATMSEVGTKLDLARAYMDMGDPEGARSILGEVLSEGSVSQKQEARRLMDTLPG